MAAQAYSKKTRCNLDRTNAGIKQRDLDRKLPSHILGCLLKSGFRKMDLPDKISMSRSCYLFSYPVLVKMM